jgi:hypothetical protein
MLFQHLLFYFVNVLKTEHPPVLSGLDFSTVYFTTYAPPRLDFSTRLCYYINTTAGVGVTFELSSALAPSRRTFTLYSSVQGGFYFG